MRKGPPIPADVQTLRVVHFESEEIADGVWQWPETRQWLHDRLGPIHFSIPEDQIPALQTALMIVGIELRG